MENERHWTIYDQRQQDFFAPNTIACERNKDMTTWFIVAINCELPWHELKLPAAWLNSVLSIVLCSCAIKLGPCMQSQTVAVGTGEVAVTRG